MLCGRYLVVLGFCKNTQLPQLVVQLFHKCLNAWLYNSEIVILKLLPLRRLCTEKGTTRIYKVLALVVNVLVYKEIFLLGAYRGFNRLNVCFSE